LITRALPYRFDAETSFELRPGGVRCLIDIPLPRSAPKAARASMAKSFVTTGVIDAVERRVAAE